MRSNASDVVDVSVQFSVSRRALWDVLLEPQSYPRLWAGIENRDRLLNPDGSTVWQVRIGDPIRRKSELVRWWVRSGQVSPPLTSARQLLPRYFTDDAPIDPTRITIEDLIAIRHTKFSVPMGPGRQIVLTSGTSGTRSGRGARIRRASTRWSRCCR